MTSSLKSFVEPPLFSHAPDDPSDPRGGSPFLRRSPPALARNIVTLSPSSASITASRAASRAAFGSIFIKKQRHPRYFFFHALQKTEKQS
jgi:hypothetical protein